jgi:NADH-quinone oxidoreductase subunit J
MITATMMTVTMGGTDMETAVFVVCALVVLAGGLGVVVSRNPVHSALSLVATLFAIAVLFLNLGAQLLAVVQVIVYTGAIVVLILFVMMLLGIDQEEDLDEEPIVGQRIVAMLVGLVFLGAVLAVANSSRTTCSPSRSPPVCSPSPWSAPSCLPVVRPTFSQSRSPSP